LIRTLAWDYLVAIIATVGRWSVCLAREVGKDCKASLTESWLEGVRMQAGDRLLPATKAIAG